MSFSPEQLEACLLQLTRPNTEEIRQAEVALKSYLREIASVPGFLTQIQHSSHVVVRQLAAILLRKRIAKHWPKLDDASKNAAKQLLLQRAAEDQSPIVTRSIVALIATVAIYELPTGNWTDLMVFITTCAKSPQANQREISMQLLQALTECMGSELRPHFNDLLQLYAAGLSDAGSEKVRVASMRAASAMVDFLDDEDLEKFRQLIPMMLEVLQHCLVNHLEDEAKEFIEMFSDIVSNPYPVLGDYVGNFVELLLRVNGLSELEQQTRTSASYTLGEFIKTKPKTIGKRDLVGKIFRTMLEIIAQDDAVSCGLISNLLERDSNDADEDVESPGYLAQQTLDTLALSVPPKYTNGVVFGMCSEFMQSPDYRMRKAGVLALGILSEGCCEFMSSNLVQILPAVYQTARDSERQVREASCFALGQFAEFLQPDITEHFNEILPIGIQLLDDGTEAIKGTSLYLLDEITQNMESEQVLPYLDTLVTKLVHALAHSKPQLQKMALDTLGSIAIGAKEAFLPYFQRVVELIQPFWGITDPNFLFLRGAAIECLGYFATALGKDTFRQFFEPSMPHVFSCFELDDSELKEQAFVYFINVSSIFKEEFAPFLEAAVSQIVTVLKSSDIQDVDDTDAFDQLCADDEDDEDDGEAYRSVSIRTDALNCKVRAIAAVEELALNCGAVFERFIPTLLEPLSEMVDYIHEDVRAAVAEALAALVICSFDAAHPGSVDQQMWTKGDVNVDILTPNNKVIVEAVMKCLTEDLLEDAEEVVVEKAFSGIKAISARLGPVPSFNFMDSIKKNVNAVLNHDHVCQQMQEEDEEGKEGGSVLEAASELVGVLGKCYGEQFLPVFQELYPLLLNFTGSLRASSDRAAVVGCFAEVLRELGPHALNFVESVFPVIIQCLTSDNMVLRANSAFCMGILVEISSDKLFGAYDQILQSLRPLFETSSNGDVVVDNAAAAVARMIISGVNHLPLDQVLPVFLGALPLKADFDETAVVFKCVNGLVAGQHPSIPNALPLVFEVYAKSLANNSNVDEEIQAEIKQCIRGLLSSSEAQVTQVIGSLQPEHQAVLQSSLQQ